MCQDPALSVMASQSTISIPEDTDWRSSNFIQLSDLEEEDDSNEDDDVRGAFLSDFADLELSVGIGDRNDIAKINVEEPSIIDDDLEETEGELEDDLPGLSLQQIFEMDSCKEWSQFRVSPLSQR